MSKRTLIPAVSTLALAACMALGNAGAALADTATSTPPSYCANATSTMGYFVFTDQASYTPGQTINFCLIDNSTNPLFLQGTHPWTITDASGTAVFTPGMGTLVDNPQGTSFFVDSWNGLDASSTQVATGTYQVNFAGFPGSPFATFMIMDATTSMGTTTATSTATTTATSTPGTNVDLTALVSALQSLENQYPAFVTQIEGFINSLLGVTTGGTGTTTGTGSGTIDQNGQTFSLGGSVDFSGRNFNHEENVTVSLNGSQVATAHADGGGNFSTGSIALPGTAGTYTYAFMGASGDSASATITVH